MWLAFDDDNVYVTFRNFESQPDRVVAKEMRRDHTTVWSGDDIVSFIFDTFHDRRSGVEFTINSIGGRQDGQTTNERQWNGDWNTIWDFAVGRFEGGWIVETAIPFKSLRYRPGADQTWGFNAFRTNRWKNELSYPVPGAEGARAAGAPHGLARGAHRRHRRAVRRKEPGDQALRDLERDTDSGPGARCPTTRRVMSALM